MDEEIARRLDSIERRLATLEGGCPPTPAAREDPFWALNRLEAEAVDGVMFAGQVQAPTGGQVSWQWGTPTATLLGQPWSAAAPVLSALAHPVRLQILHSVLHGVSRSAELAEQPGLGSTGQLYHHLRELTSAGWLRATGRGQHGIPGERLVPLLVILAATDALGRELPPADPPQPSDPPEEMP